MSAPRRIAVCTAVTGSFVSFARVMARSVRAHHPDIPVFAAVAERDGVVDWGSTEDVTSIPIAQLGVPDLPRSAFLSSPHELTVVIKPRIMRWLLDRGFDVVLFIDSDILVLDDLAPVMAVSAAHAITLVPHLLRPPMGEDRVARELLISQAGTFNGGFVAVSARPEAVRFLDWLSERLLTHNRLQPALGLHHDQRWYDLVPGFFEDVAVLRDPGCNVAYWNLAERPIRFEDGRWMVDDHPCRFFHFSGFDPARPELLSRHAPHLTQDVIGAAASLVDTYAAAVRHAGWDQTRAYPYSFGRFADGAPIPALARTLYGELGEPEAAAFGDPFRADPPGSVRAWLMEPDPAPGPGAGVPRFWRRVHQQRPDLQQAFADPAGADRLRFERWVEESGRREYGVDARLTPAT